MSLLLARRKFIAQSLLGALSTTGVAGAGWLSLGSGEASLTPCVRPPGALPEKEFLAACIRCGRCIDACPNRAIVPFTEESGQELAMQPGLGQRNTPVIFPRKQACMVCNGVPGNHLLCTEACPSGALQKTEKTLESIQQNVKMGTAEIDTHLCYSYNDASCGVCVRSCPLEGKALRAGMWEKPILNTDACIGCGLCERACIRYPQAIRVRPRGIG